MLRKKYSRMRKMNYLMMKNGTIMKMKQLRRKNGRMMELKQMSSGGDSDRHREHLGVSQTKQAKKKKSRRPIDPEDIVGSISSAPECISHDTHLFVVPFGTVNPRQYYPNYHRLVDASSTS
ncbi:hypothetical protein H5410_014799 [Solanum commersonii]|uniref:Uncharacterized protein n=1 Tax=Solanum commersonii TaxID=4109 RepID=A0A9J5ZSJ0_SOLCO|nr:hypothetical protein H5410_014799 [Solanum commersonii]